MFTTILGIPAHPLLIHAAVVFIPLLIVGAIVFTVWPRARHRVDWAVGGLAVIAPIAAFAAKQSGQAFRDRLITKHLTSPGNLQKIAVHQSYGTKTFDWTVGLGLVTLALVIWYWRAGRGAVSTVGTGADGTAAAGAGAADGTAAEAGAGAAAHAGTTAGSSRVVWLIGAALTIVLGVITGYYVFKTGDTGAHIVWQGF